MDEYLGIVKLFAGNFAPQGWAFCNGSILSISQYTALFSLLGTTYGGNGTTTFALPDLRSRVPVHSNNGQAGPGLQAIPLGQSGGTSNVTLNTSQMPAHTHQLMVNNTNATASNPTGGVPAVSNFDDAGSGNNVVVNSYAAAPTGAASAQAIAPVGGNQPLSVMQPYLGLNYIICLQGLYPSRS